MKKLLLLSILIMAAQFGSAQIGQGGKPISFRYSDQLEPVLFERMPDVDVETLLAEDEINYPNKVGPYRFGEKHFVSMNLENSGQWETLPSGDRIWRLGIMSQNAFSLNFIFENFHIPEGGKLFIYNMESGHVTGAFTSFNNREDGWFGTFLLKGDQAVLEYYEPLEVVGQGSMELKEIVHGYRDILGWYKNDERGGGSGSCNIDVECPLGNGWEDQIRSVGILISSGNGFCTGAMVADVPQSGTPYFLTANHCGGNVGNWSVGFNYEVTSCGGANVSQNYGSLSGATQRASNAGSDMSLLEWDNMPPESYGVFYAGWSNINTAASQSTGIHHPSGDVKKICRDNNATTTSTYSGADCWRIGAWEQGTTEPGSSGSPLFDQNKRITGQLYGGSASCSNTGGSDWYGKFSTSWNGPSSSSRLRDWLDPQSTGTSTVDGFDPYASTISYDAQLSSINQPSNGAQVCESSVAPSITIRNNGSVTLTSITVSYNLNGTNGSTTWTGSLASNATTSFTLPSLNLNNGSNTLTVTLSNPNNQNDENNTNNTASVTFSSSNADSFVTLIINTDNYGAETTWSVTNNGGGTVASGGPYTTGTVEQIVEEICVQSGSCYTFVINDSEGDGICCGFGEGSYSLGDADGISIVTGAEFATSETTQFCVPTTNDCAIVYDPFESNASGFALYPNSGGGYIAGSNSFGDLAKAQQFIAPNQPSQISGIVVWVAGKTDAGASVTANLYQLNGSGTNVSGATNSAPGTILASATKQLSRVDTSSFLTKFDFNAPVTVTSGYAIGLDFSSFGNNDELGIVTNVDGDANGADLAWEKWSDGEWYSMNSAWNNQNDGDFDLGIFPVLCPLVVTGVQDLSGQFNLFPNPNNGMFTVLNMNAASGNLEVFDTQGKLVHAQSFQGQTTLNVDLSQFNAGLYFVKASTENGVWNSRVVVQ